MFGFGKKKKEAAAQEASSADVYVAPAAGEYLPLSEVSDPVFSQGVMGDGYAVNPTAGTIVAPVAGTIALIQDTLHAFMLRTETAARYWSTSVSTPLSSVATASPSSLT